MNSYEWKGYNKGTNGVLTNLVASYDMDDDKHVSSYYEPSGFVEGDEDVVFNGIAKDPIANESNREVTEGHNRVCDQNSPPHGTLWGLLWGGRDGCLNLQHHIVSSIGKSHVT